MLNAAFSRESILEIIHMVLPLRFKTVKKGKALKKKFTVSQIKFRYRYRIQYPESGTWWWRSGSIDAKKML